MYGPDVNVALYQVDGLIPRGSRTQVFEQIYWVFLVLGTLVGVVVISYMLYNAYKYRARPGDGEETGGDDRPSLGELPSGGGKGRKLFLSLFISAVIVISLIAWTYGTLLYIESPADSAFQEDTEAMDVTVVGRQFIWEFHYANGHRSVGELRVPKGTRVQLSVTSADVFHNFGVPGLRVKTDAIPGQTTETWFLADEVGTYTAQCYELCGAGHSAMNAQVVVMEPEAFEEWYAGTGNGSGNGTNATNSTAAIGVPA